MDDIEGLLSEIHLNKFDVGSSCWVDVTHINNPHSFYVRPRAYNRYLAVIQNRGERMKAYEIEMGNIVIYKSYKLKSYLRGKVLSIENKDDKQVYKVFALDIGIIESSLSLRRIWRQNHERNLPPLATHCQLANCGPLGETWDHNATTAMYTYVKGERAKMVIRSKTNEYLIVELYNSCPDDIATLLALTNFTTFGYVDPSVSRFKNNV